MSTTFVIQKGVAVPERSWGPGRKAGDSKYTGLINSLQVGDMINMSKTSYTGLWAMCKKLGNGYKFVTRAQADKTINVWRTA